MNDEQAYEEWMKELIGEVQRLVPAHAKMLVEGHILSNSGVFEAGFETWHPSFKDAKEDAPRFIALFDLPGSRTQKPRTSGGKGMRRKKG